MAIAASGGGELPMHVILNNPSAVLLEGLQTPLFFTGIVYIRGKLTPKIWIPGAASISALVSRGSPSRAPSEPGVFVLP